MPWCVQRIKAARGVVQAAVLLAPSSRTDHHPAGVQMS